MRKFTSVLASESKTLAKDLSLTGGCPVDLYNDFIGARVVQKRSELGLSQKQMAAAIGVSAKKMAAYEAGKEMIPAKVLVSIAHYLKIDMTYFYPIPNSNLRSANDGDKLAAALHAVSDIKENLGNNKREAIKELEALLIKLSRRRPTIH